MLKKTLLATLVLVLAMLLVACGGGGDSGGEEAADGGVGDTAKGEKLYNSVTIGSASAPGCVTCHSTEDGVVLVGPSHAGLAGRAGSYVEGKSAEDYLRESLTDPNAHIVDGFTPDVMYQNYGEELQARDINDLVAFMLTMN